MRPLLAVLILLAAVAVWTTGVHAYDWIVLHCPNGGEVWTVGDNQPILWESEGIDEVDIFYGNWEYKQWYPIAQSNEACRASGFWTTAL